MDANNILNLRADVISQVFNFIILEDNNFSGFSKLLIVWAMGQSRQTIKFVLESLNWDVLYQFHNEPIEVVRDCFEGFIQFAVRFDVEQAKFYNSTRKLFLREDVQQHLSVLSDLSGNHFPSRFSYLFFKAIYRTFQRNETAMEMNTLLNNTYLRNRIIEQMSFLQDMYFNISEVDYLLPVFKFCPNARNPNPMYQVDGVPLGDETWYSLCPRTVEEIYIDDNHPWGKSITMKHMWETDCIYCKLQIILYKILLSYVQT